MLFVVIYGAKHPRPYRIMYIESAKRVHSILYVDFYTHFHNFWHESSDTHIFHFTNQLKIYLQPLSSAEVIENDTFGRRQT